VIRFGVFEVDLASGDVFRHGHRVRLQELPFQALAALLERPGEVVTREELQRRLWPDTTIDYERGLNKAINRVREALRDDADNPRFIETLPQRGYRFIAPVERIVPAAQPEPPRVNAGRPKIPLGLVAAALLVAALGMAAAWYQQRRSSARPITSIAVLPLENLSGDPAQEYFSDGMTDELIGEIGRMVPVRVISRTSVMRYKVRPRKSLPEVAAELKADAVLEGTVAQSNGKVRINVELVRVEDDRRLWSERYERDLADVMSVQSAVARAVAREIRVNLASRGSGASQSARTVKPDAYQAFLRGNYFLHRGISGVPKSIEFFTKALELDPGHADSHAGMAEALVFAAIFGLQSPGEAFPAARGAALRALHIDPSNAAAHNALADIKKGYEWNLAGAESEYKRALELNPSHLLTRMWYAECLSRMGRHEEALAESARAIALDPVSPISYNTRSMLLFRARRYDEAIRVGDQALELDPNFVNTLWFQGLSWAAKGEFDKAEACLAKGAEVNKGPLFRALLGHVYGLEGERSKARQVLDDLRGMASQRYVTPMDFAVVFAGMGDADETFRWLNVAREQRAARVHEIAWMYFDRYRADPRYTGLLRRTGLR
jgi:TolB-like protein/DNA-binding winged helix-turn-helix (wHTH) protein/Flp pilus assembly protein TadD